MGTQKSSRFIKRGFTVIRSNIFKRTAENVLDVVRPSPKMCCTAHLTFGLARLAVRRRFAVP